MKIMLTGINAKYIHSNLAIRYISEYAKEHHSIDMQTVEFTINQRSEFILSSIYKQKPDVIGFSCYIWNFDLICRIVRELKAVLPNTVVFLGGPEVTYNPQEVLQKTKADIVVVGEGEQICSNLAKALIEKSELSSVKGIVYKENDQIFTNQPHEPMDMALVPFVYDEVSTLQNKIIYYEASRGCPFSCQYCLSCNEHAVRFMPLERVYKHLDFFLENKVRQVKLVDRTFNCKKDYAMSIWQYLKEHDNGYTNFHFEIAGELLDDETCEFLSTIRKGFFQFEIGVQSTNHDTLVAIKRITKLEKLRDIVSKLQAGGNIHLHLDLIIGLPFENYSKFKKSFNDVYSLSPDQLQVGFLKLLKGSGLYADREKYGLVHSPFPPYEIMFTKELTFDEILKLKMIEEMVELYYNSNRFKRSVYYLCTKFSSAFDMFESLATFYEKEHHHERSHSYNDYYTIIWDFAQGLSDVNLDILKWLIKFDMYSHEKVKKLPEFISSNETENKATSFAFFDDRENIEKFLPEYLDFDTKQIYRQAHIEYFPFNPLATCEEMTGNTDTSCKILFNYKNCDLLGNAQIFFI